MDEARKPKFFYGYVIAAAALCTAIVTYGTFFTFGIFFKPLLTEFGSTRTMIAGTFSLYMLIHGLLSIVAGRLNDRFGPRIIISVCGLVLALGYFSISRITAIWHLYLFYGVIIGAGMSGGFVPLASTVARWFVKRRGLMTGIVLSGSGLGSLIMAPIAYWLISSYGWRTSYVIVGVIALAFITVAAQSLRRDPGEVGQLPYGADEAKAESLDLQTSGLSLRGAIHTRQFWILCAMYLCVGLCIFTIMVHIAAHVVELEISAATAATVLGVIGGLNFGGRIIMGATGDRIGPRLGLITSFILMSTALFWLQLAREVWMFYLFAVIFGFAFGGLAIFQPIIVAELFGLGSHGVLIGSVGFSFTVGSAIGPVLAGRIFDVTNSYQMAFLICGGAAVTGIILASLLRPLCSQGGRNDPRRSTGLY